MSLLSTICSAIYCGSEAYIPKVNDKLMSLSLSKSQCWSVLQALIDDVETDWFGIFSVLLLPCTALNDASRAVVDEIKGSGFSRSVANVSWPQSFIY